MFWNSGDNLTGYDTAEQTEVAASRAVMSLRCLKSHFLFLLRFLQCLVAITASQAIVCFQKGKTKQFFTGLKCLLESSPFDVTSGLFFSNDCFFPAQVWFCLFVVFFFPYVCGFLFHLYEKFCYALLLFVFQTVFKKLAEVFFVCF